MLRNVPWLTAANVVIAGLLLSAAAQAQDAGADVQELVKFIDREIEQRWMERGVIPVPPADDAEFIRRVYLDLTGRIPTAGEVRRFLLDTTPDKRAQLVDNLLAAPSYAENFSGFWQSLLIPEADDDQQLFFVASEFTAWLRKRLSANTPFDAMVRELLTVPLNAQGSGAYAYYSGEAEAKPTAFYAAKDVKPENLAAATARVFLGLRVDCAQCHDHPFAHWKRDEFWAYAAFFTGIQRPSKSPLESLVDLFRDASAGPLNIRIADTDRVVVAAFLDGSQPTASGRPRELVADWITHSQNRFFPRATVNRLWAYLFGAGLVDPVDDMDAQDASHPALLDGLAQRFVASSYDLRFVLRGIMNSRAYQLSSSLGAPAQRDLTLFARKTPKKMTPRQLYDSIQEAMGSTQFDAFADPYQNSGFGPNRQFQQMLEGAGERPVERSTSVLEALTLMNGPLTHSAVDEEQSPLVSALQSLPEITDEQRIETLYLATLSRPPSEKESSRLLVRFEGVSESNQRRRLCSDILWALINSSEFVLNH